MSCDGSGLKLYRSHSKLMKWEKTCAEASCLGSWSSSLLIRYVLLCVRLRLTIVTVTFTKRWSLFSSHILKWSENMNKKSYKIFKQDMPRNLSRKQLTSAGVSTTSIVIKGLRIYFLIRVDSVRNATHHYFLDCIEVALAHGGAHTHVDTHTHAHVYTKWCTHTHTLQTAWEWACKVGGITAIAQETFQILPG